MKGIWNKCTSSAANFQNIEQIDCKHQGVVELGNVLNLNVRKKDIAELVKYTEEEITFQFY